MNKTKKLGIIIATITLYVILWHATSFLLHETCMERMQNTHEYSQTTATQKCEFGIYEHVTITYGAGLLLGLILIIGITLHLFWVGL